MEGTVESRAKEAAAETNAQPNAERAWYALGRIRAMASDGVRAVEAIKPAEAADALRLISSFCEQVTPWA